MTQADWGDVVRVLGGLAIGVGGLLLVGTTVRSWFGQRRAWPLDAASGFVTLGTGMFACSLVGLYRAAVMRTLCALALSAAAYRLGPRGIAGRFRPPRGARRPRPPVPEAAALGVLVTVALFPLVRAAVRMLVPDPNVDILITHLSSPELALRLGHYAVDGVNPLCLHPNLAENVYLAASLFGGEGAQRAIGDAILLGGVVTFIRACAAEERTGRLPVAVGAVLVMPLTEFHLATTKGDAPGIGLWLMAVALLFGPGDPRGRTRPWFGWMLLGAAAACKYTFVAAAGVTWLAFGRRGGRLAALGWMLAVPLGWIARNTVATGDPLFPSLSLHGVPLLTAAGWDRRNTLAAWRDFHYWEGASRTGWAGVPVQVVVDGLPAVFLPFLGAVPRTLGLAWGCGAAFYALLTVLVGPGLMSARRYASPGMTLAVLSACAASAGWPLRRRAAFAVAVAVWGILIQARGGDGGKARAAWEAFRSGGSAEQFLSATHGAWWTFKGTLARDVGRREGVAWIGDTRTRGTPGRPVVGGMGAAPVMWTLAVDARDGEDVLRAARRRNIRWVAHNVVASANTGEQDAPFEWNLRMLRAARSFAEEHLEPLPVDVPGYRAFRVDRSRRPPGSGMIAVPGIESAYALGQAMVRAGRLADALTAYRALEGALPGVSGLTSREAYVLRRMGRWREAHALYRRLAATDLEEEDVHAGLALSALALGRDEEAIREARLSLGRDPHWRGDMLHVFVAAADHYAWRTMRVHGDRRRARAWLREAVQLGGASPALRESLAALDRASR